MQNKTESKVAQPPQRPNDPLSPLDLGNRLHHIDSLRGFALLGILIVNMLAFQYGIVGADTIRPNLSTFDGILFDLIEWLFKGSFYPIFSMLFGFGAVIMWERAQAKGRPFNMLFFRRILILLAIGFIHLHFIWDGDILLTYAMAGLVFLLFIKRKPKTLLIWALVLAFFINAPGLAPTGDEGDVDLTSYGLYEQSVLSEGTYAEITAHRFTSNPFEKIDFGLEIGSLEHQVVISILNFFNTFVVTTQAFMLFLVGAYIAKKRWLHNISANRRLLGRITILFVVIGLALKGSMVLNPSNGVLDYLGYILGGPLAAIGYVTGFTLLFAKLESTFLVKGFNAIGRMALTNYLTHSVIMTTLFYGYGFGLLGKLGVLAGLLIAIALIIVQMFFSRWWLKRYSYGPMEWLWRSGTYLKLQPMKKMRSRNLPEN